MTEARAARCRRESELAKVGWGCEEACLAVTSGGTPRSTPHLHPNPSCSLHAPFPTVSRPCVISGRLHPLMVCFDPISRILSCCSSTFTSLRSSNPMLPEPPSPPSPCVYLSITAIRWRSDMCWRQSKTPFFGAIHHALLLFASRISAPEGRSSGIESVALCWI